MSYGDQYGTNWQEYGNYDRTSLPQYSLNTNTAMPAAVPAISMAPQAASASTASMPNPWIQGAGLALGGAGTLLGAYGAYKQSQAMEDQNKLARDNYELQKTLAFQDRATSEEERQRQAALQGGQYAMGVGDRKFSRYGEYNRRTGG